MVVWCLFGACMVYKEENISWGRCLFGAVYDAKRTKYELGAVVVVQCLYSADYSKRRTTDPSFQPIIAGCDLVQ